MADDTIKRLEARVTELENKLSQAGPPDFSPDEMAAFQKVSESLSGGAAAGCVVCGGGTCLSECKVCIKVCKVCVVSCVRCIQPCINECICGPCNICGHGGPFGGGGFGGFGL